MKNYSFYCCDIETGSLDLIDCAVIEISLCRLLDNSQKTWCLKPFDTDKVEPGALRVNGHKLDDLQHKTKEGRERYLDPYKTIVEIENWISSDNVPTESRVLLGQNIEYDKSRLEQLWIKCGSKESFPFGRRVMDTMIFELMIDYAKETFADSYSLSALTKKYGVTNKKAHSASEDVLATKAVFDRQIDFVRKLLKSDNK
jgi:DNA polymerase III epsilon subunit-like protein